MTNLLRFPRSGKDLRPPRHHVGAALLAQPPALCHTVQLYESEAFLLDTVAHFFAAGLGDGDTVLAIGTASRRAGVLDRLGSLASEEQWAEQLTMLDARDTLSKLTERGVPDEARFEDTILRLIDALREARPGAPIRVWGEMVELLCDDGRADAAIRLEELWHETIERSGISLLCSYRMECFDDTAAGSLLAVCARHSHVLPTESFAQIAAGEARLREVTLLQQRARSLESEVAQRREVETALRSALASQRRAEDELAAAREREHATRGIAEAADAANEAFAGFARAPYDLVSIVAKAVDDARAAHPGRLIVLRTGERCLARIDPHRFERALASLLANALAHGDPSGPVTVSVLGQGELATISVEDHGPPIDAAAMPRLFDGSILDLYLAERIVSAHGGTLSARSSADGGRSFEILLARDG